MKTPIKRRMRAEVALGKPLVRSALVMRGMRGNTLSEMNKKGVLFRVARGVYASAIGSTSEYFDYELAGAAVPRGVFTLRSALRLHGLTDDNPMRMTIAIPSNSHKVKTTLPLDFVYMRGDLLSEDVEELSPNGTPIRVFSVERTIVECFKARNKIGIGVCVQALREALDRGNVFFLALWEAMKRCRMTKVMAPYLEGLT